MANREGIIYGSNIGGSGVNYVKSTTGRQLIQTSSLLGWTNGSGTTTLETVPGTSIQAISNIQTLDARGDCYFDLSTSLAQNRFMSLLVYAEAPYRSDGVQAPYMPNYQVFAYSGTTSNAAQSIHRLRQGWNWIPIASAQNPDVSRGISFDQALAQISGTFNLATGNLVRLYLRRELIAGSVGGFATSTYSHRTYAHFIRYGETFVPNISVTFDDALSTQYTNARAILNAYGIKATFNLVKDWQSGLGSLNYMTQAQIQQLLADGHHIGAHSVNHNNSTPGSTVTTPANLSESKFAWDMIPWLQRYCGVSNFGPDDCFLHAALPGSHGDLVTADVEQEYVRRALYELGYLSARSAIEGVDEHYWLTPYQRRAIVVYSTASGFTDTTPAMILGRVDTVAACGGDAQLTFHGIGAPADDGASTNAQLWDTTADFETIIKGLAMRRAAGQITCNPVATQYRHFRSTPPSGVVARIPLAA